MARLSIIVLSEGNDSLLESTLVSVLENRPENCEILVAHDGSYADQYEIGDEVSLLPLSNTGTIKRLNLAASHASSDIVSVISEGTVVFDGWTNGLERAFDDPAVASICVGGESSSGRVAGITPLTRCDSTAIRKGQADASLGNIQYAGPSLACGFYRSRTLAKVGSFDSSLSKASADLELAWLMQSLGLNCHTLPGVRYRSESSHRCTSTSLNEAAQLCVAYGISPSGLLPSILGYAASLLTLGHKLGLSWSSGLRGGSVTRNAVGRLNRASQEDSLEEEILPFPSSSAPVRRAA